MQQPQHGSRFFEHSSAVFLLSALHWLKPHYSRGWRHFCGWQSANTESALSAQTLETATARLAKIHQPLLGPLLGDTFPWFHRNAAPTALIFVFASLPCAAALFAAESSLDGENRAIKRLLVDKQTLGEMSYSICLATTSCKECISAVWPH